MVASISAFISTTCLPCANASSTTCAPNSTAPVTSQIDVDLFAAAEEQRIVRERRPPARIASSSAPGSSTERASTPA